MSIEGKDNPSQIRNAMQQAQEQSRNKSNPNPAQEGEQTSRREEARRGSDPRYASMSQIGRVNPTPIAMSNTAETLEQFRRDFTEAMPSKDDNNMIVAQIFPIDASVAGLPFSMVTVAGFKRNAEDLGIGHHTFLLAGSADPLRPREDTYRGNRVTIVQVPGEGYDDRAREIVKDILTRHYPNKPLYSGDAETIANNFPTFKDEPQAIADCVKNAFAAIKNAIDRNDPNVPKLSLKNDDPKDDSYNTIHIQHRQNHIFDRGHQPVRADVIVDLMSREHRGRNSRDQMEQMVAGTRISRVGGYFDLVYAPADGATTRNELYARRNSGRSNGDEYQLYALRFINTFTDTIDFSPQAQLLAQATVNAVADSQEIMRAFEPNQSLGEDDTRNIGALAIEPNLQELERNFGERWETKTSAFTQAKRQALLRATIRPGVIFSVDVPECGASTWQGLDLMAIANGSARAMDRLYDAACVLTDGHFEDLYRKGDPIIDNHVERILGGYYTEGQNGQRLDLRDFDYLALLNMLRPEKEEDMLLIQRWGMAASTSDDTILSQSDRYETLRDFIPTHVITGAFQRYNYNINFNEALVEAITRCKVSLNPTTSSRDGAERFRTTYGNIDNILNRPGSGGLFRNQRQRNDRYEDNRYGDDRRDSNTGRW